MITHNTSMLKPLAQLRHFVTGQNPMVGPSSFLFVFLVLVVVA